MAASSPQWSRQPRRLMGVGSVFLLVSFLLPWHEQCDDPRPAAARQPLVQSEPTEPPVAQTAPAPAATDNPVVRSDNAVSRDVDEVAAAETPSPTARQSLLAFFSFHRAVFGAEHLMEALGDIHKPYGWPLILLAVLPFLLSVSVITNRFVWLASGLGMAAPGLWAFSAYITSILAGDIRFGLVMAGIGAFCSFGSGVAQARQAQFLRRYSNRKSDGKRAIL